MSNTKEMLKNTPGKAPVDTALISACIDACTECSQTCVACADACIGEPNPSMLAACIRLDLACADICNATGNIMSRELAGDPGMAPNILDACRKACDLCATECEKHADNMEHCRICAESCRRCEKSCKELMEALIRG